MKDQLDLSAGYEESRYLFSKLSQRSKGEVWASQPILSLVGPSGYGKSQFIQYLYFRYCNTPALPHIALDFGQRDTPRDLLNILGELRKSLSRQRDEHGSLLAFPRFDIIYMRLKRSEGQGDSNGDETTELLSDLIGLLGNVHFLFGVVLFILKLVVAHVPQLRLLLQRVVDVAYERAGQKPQWRWYQDQVKKFREINLPDDAPVSDVRKRLNEMCSMGEPERRFLIEQILPKAFLADLRYGMYDNEALLLREGPQYVVIFLDSFEVLLRQSESTARQLLEALALNEYRKRGESDPLLLVVASEDRLPDMSRAQLNRHFPPEASITGTVQARGEALYTQWVQQLPTLEKRRTLRLEQCYLPLPLSTLSIGAIRDYLLRLDQRNETYRFANEALIEDIQRATRGYPIFLERIAGALQTPGQIIGTLARDVDDLFASEQGEQIVDHLLTLHCTQVEERQFMLSAVPLTLTQDILRLVLEQARGEAPDDTELSAEWKRYRELPFLLASEDKKHITFVPGVRTIFLKKLQIVTADSENDYQSVHQQLYTYFTQRIEQRAHKKPRKEKDDELNRCYHALALGLYQPVLQQAVEALSDDPVYWQDLMEVVAQAPTQKLSYDQIKAQADAYLQEDNVNELVRAIVLYTWLLASPGSDARQVSRLWQHLGAAYQRLQANNPNIKQDTATRCYRRASQVLDRPAPITRPLAQPADPITVRPGSESVQRARQFMGATYRSVRTSRKLQVASLLIVAVAIAAPLLAQAFLVHTPVLSSSFNPYSLPFAKLVPSARNHWVGVTVEPDGEFVGLSDGTIPFDYRRPDGTLKIQATNQLRVGNFSVAKGTLQQALQTDINDAEALIYQEDVGFYLTKKPCIVFVLVTRIVEDDSTEGVNDGRDNLQGVYLAQHAYNLNHQQKPLCIYVANLGVNTGYEPAVLGQIVKAAAASHGAIEGLIGWPGLTDGPGSEAAVHLLESTHLPLISLDSYDNGAFSPNIFHIVPSRQDQGVRAAIYAAETLSAKRVALITDPDDPYSRALADGFKQRFEADGQHQVVDVETYTTGVTSDPQLSAELEQARKARPDCIYFTGGIQEGSTLLEALRTAPASLHVLGSEQLYPLLRLSANDSPSLGRLAFTSAAYPGASSALLLGQLYQAAFDSANQDKNRVFKYGYSIPDSESILAYDAMETLIRAYTDSIDTTSLLASLKDVQVDGASRANITFTDFNELSDQRLFVIAFQLGAESTATFL